MNAISSGMAGSVCSKAIVIVEGALRGGSDGSALESCVVFWAGLILASKSTVFSFTIISDTLPCPRCRSQYGRNLCGLPLASTTLGHPSI